MRQQILYELIKASLCCTDISSIMCKNISEEVYEEMKLHALLMLPAHILSSLQMNDELRNVWEKDIILRFSYYCKYINIESNLPVVVPYVILKGTAAAQYYPYPQYRSMGDIDIMPSRGYMDTACNELLANGFEEITTQNDWERGRHRTFIKQGVPVEVHSFFASMNDPEKVRIFDDMLFDNINPSHILPDLINGMVLIEHVNQHMEEGIGLRQIIDWMMFVDKCLDEEKWSEFQKMLQKTGLEKLALTVTRMCEIYFDLPEHMWCRGVNKKICADLMDYVLASGTFGMKFDEDEQIALARVSQFTHPIRMIKELNKRGSSHLEPTKKSVQNPLLSILRGVRSVNKPLHFIKHYRKAASINRMFDSLGVRRASKGLVYYENGKYIKK